MAAGTLYTYSNSFRAFKALIAAQYSGAKIDVDTAFKFGETNKSADFLKNFPLGKVPAFKSDSGDCIFESNAIASYVGNPQLNGSNVRDQAFIQQWISFGENEILPAACTWVFPCMGITQYNKNETEKAKTQVTKALNALDQILLTRTFLVGERVTLADICVVCNLFLLYQQVLDPSFRKPFQNVNRWFTTCVNQPEFKNVIGDFKCCEKMAQFDAKKYAELHGGDKKDKKKETPQKKEKPKQEKKAKKKEEPEEDDEEPPKPKEDKDPFAPFPKGTFNMDEFKKVYSNEDTETKAIPWFWENFDAEHYSVWLGEYMYPEELAKLYMSSNLISGMFQRIDKLRKNAFASVLQFGVDNSNEIAGIWIWRGDKLAFELSPDWQIDYESYKWTKLDVKDEKTKKMMNDYFLWEGEYKGKPCAQGKTFK